ncbi:MAG: hypothetical protein LBI03_01490 [Clostridiales bacterium]|jgi:hypothetical protein|nr:hypothetical protein [Clostridiales bacterium]
MTIKEDLSWIIDYTNLSGEKEYKENIDFVHSLGLKCDSVGWCELDLGRGDIDKLFEKMNLYAETHNALLRGNYWKEYNDFESEWYFLDTMYGEDNPNYVTVLDNNRCEMEIRELRAYRIPKFTAVVNNAPFDVVTEHFRDACIKHKFSGVDFYWIRDTGKYDATQYFGLILKNGVSEFTCDCDLRYSNETKTKDKKTGSYANAELYQKFQNIGGRLAELSRMFYDLSCIFFPLQGGDFNT